MEHWIMEVWSTPAGCRLAKPLTTMKRTNVSAACYGKYPV
jgi:hypothetical protein